MIHSFEFLGRRIVYFKPSYPYVDCKKVMRSDGRGYTVALLTNGNIAYGDRDAFRYGIMSPTSNSYHRRLFLAEAMYKLGAITKEVLEQESEAFKADQNKRDLRSNSADFIWQAKLAGIKLTKAQIDQCVRQGVKQPKPEELV